jgi:hypothetical protein
MSHQTQSVHTRAKIQFPRRKLAAKAEIDSDSRSLEAICGSETGHVSEEKSSKSLL